MNIEKLKRAHAGYVDTPLEPMDALSKTLGGRLYIKRDDLTGLALGATRRESWTTSCNMRWITVIRR